MYKEELYANEKGRPVKASFRETTARPRLPHPLDELDRRRVDRLDEEALDLALWTAMKKIESAQRPLAGQATRIRRPTHLDRVNLALELASLVGRDGRSDDRARDAAGTAEGGLGGDEDVGDVLVLAEEREVEQDLDRLGVYG